MAKIHFYPKFPLGCSVEALGVAEQLEDVWLYIVDGMIYGSLYPNMTMI